MTDHEAGRPRHSTVARDRHGRGLRSPLLPPGVPAFRTRAEVFDAAVLQVVGDAESRWPGEISTIEFAIDDVPPVPSDGLLSSDDAVVDNGVPLTRFQPPGVDRRGRPTKARIVIYRRPLEMRAATSAELAELVADVLVEQITAILGEGGSPGP